MCRSPEKADTGLCNSQVLPPMVAGYSRQGKGFAVDIVAEPVVAVVEVGVEVEVRIEPMAQRNCSWMAAVGGGSAAAAAGRWWKLAVIGRVRL